MKETHTILIPTIHNEDFLNLKLDVRTEFKYFYMTRMGEMMAYLIELDSNDLLVIKLTIPGARIRDSVSGSGAVHDFLKKFTENAKSLSADVLKYE